MNGNMVGWSQYRKSLLKHVVLLLIVGMTGCSRGPLRIHMDFVPTGSLRLAQVTATGSREEVVQAKDLYDAIIASGIKDSEIADGSVVLARIYCCGGMTKSWSSEVVNSTMLYVPKGLSVALGDIVEVRVGHPPKKEEPGVLNVVTRVVQKADDDGKCWWDPRDDRLWLRVLYCDWMPKEGWIKQGGINPVWYLPAGPSIGAK
ncbi:hypothetical protein KP004_04660 [Geomonas oryzisoli]|uniref:Uncharacterized protein n=1 Tax=Geomonas oryzisoli TaxID=2847992 RepID=A0ABX8JCN4_9BACT|nr:hypothetical protein [Geomonas oryzisoli]QWV94482.1 hypothetical protein KP004_04660 [Geomonas oryzisoli]